MRVYIMLCDSPNHTDIISDFLPPHFDYLDKKFPLHPTMLGQHPLIR